MRGGFCLLLMQLKSILTQTSLALMPTLLQERERRQTAPRELLSQGSVVVTHKLPLSINVKMLCPRSQQLAH